MPNGMFRLSRESQQTARNRVLLVGLEPAIQDSISVVLNTMGWGCIAVSDLEEVQLVLQQGSFEAVVLSLRHSEEDLERIILAIKDIRPTLAERIVVVSSRVVEFGILELIERYDSLIYRKRRSSRGCGALWKTSSSSRHGAESLPAT
jgi:hypothetical protein